MKKQAKTRVLFAGLLASALMFIGTPAFAGSAFDSFSTTLPNLQQPRYVGTQTKLYTGLAGNVRITNVGADYTVNVRMRQTGTLNYGTEVFGLGDNSAASLPNSFAAGTRTGISIVNSTWALVTVSVNGSYRTY